MRINYDKLIEDAMRDLDVVNKRISELEKQKKEQDRYERTMAINLDDLEENGIVDFSANNFANIMKAISDQKNEWEGHALADEVMVEFLRHLGYGKGCDIFNNMSKWYA